MEPLVSPAIAAAFNAWRDRYVEIVTASTGIEGDVAQFKLGHSLLALMALPSGTLGDALVKSYIHLHGECGYPLDRCVFEVDTAQIDGNGTHADAWMHGLYADLDGCDLGRCLLAFGLTEFSAAAWVEAAEKAALDVLVLIGPAGEKRLSIVTVAEDDPAQERLHLRLRRLASGRTAAIGQHIIATQPYSVVHMRPTEATQVAA